MSLSPSDLAKMACAHRAAELVEDGMHVGLGTGSTAVFLVKRLGQRLRDEGLSIDCVATSEATQKLALEEGLRMHSLDALGALDLTIDGADEFDGEMSLIKGGGAALLREKIVAAASERMVVIADASKEVSALGAFALPVEVVQFAHETSRRMIDYLLENSDVDGREITLRMVGDQPLVTDEGHYIYDLHLGRIGDARALNAALNQIPGVVENGLFTDMCDATVVGYDGGRTVMVDLASGERSEKIMDL